MNTCLYDETFDSHLSEEEKRNQHLTTEAYLRVGMTYDECQAIRWSTNFSQSAKASASQGETTDPATAILCNDSSSVAAIVAPSPKKVKVAIYGADGKCEKFRSKVTQKKMSDYASFNKCT